MQCSDPLLLIFGYRRFKPKMSYWVNITPKYNNEGEVLTYTFGTNFVHGSNNNNNNIILVLLLHQQKQPQLSSGSLSLLPQKVPTLCRN